METCMMRVLLMCFILLLSTLVGCDRENRQLRLLNNIRQLSVGGENALNGFSELAKGPTLEFIQLVNRRGYPAEEHRVTTLDGYRLRFHRIPGSKRSPPAPGKPTVYVQHGLFGSSDMFVFSGPDRDLVFLLADAGYDVWLGNARGNHYSRSHAWLSPDKDPEFWSFSQHEIGVYDVTSMIDYILAHTGERTLTYIGHSMGTVIGFILLSARPEYNDKVRLVINMASVGTWQNPVNLIRLLKDNGQLIRLILRAYPSDELFPEKRLFGDVVNLICRPFIKVCKKVLMYSLGYSPKLFDAKLYLRASFNFPAGGSYQTLDHFYQNMKAAELQMYDFGRSGNLARYNQETPPLYNLWNIVIPVILIYGNTDDIGTREDSLDLVSRMRYARAEPVRNEQFNHLDFVWGKNIKILLHDRVIEILNNSIRYGSFSVL